VLLRARRPNFSTLEATGVASFSPRASLSTFAHIVAIAAHHIALRDETGVAAQSIGEEPTRRVVVPSRNV
jgi:hypothetical protein